MPDHVHLLVRLYKQLSVADGLRLVKTNSSKWVHETFPEHQAFAWQAGYGAFTVSLSGLPEVKSYLARQAEHHRTRSFKEEFIAFLKKHEIEYDEKYVWE
jgi:REP element-mobilizing transposase RayT